MNSCPFQPWEAEWETKVWNTAQRWFSGQHQIFSKEFCNWIHYNIETKLLQSICLHYGVKISWKLWALSSILPQWLPVTTMSLSSWVVSEKFAFRCRAVAGNISHANAGKVRRGPLFGVMVPQFEAILIKDFFFHLLHLTVCNIKLL